MKLIRNTFISLGIALVAVCFGAIILFNWSVTGWKALAVPTGSMRPTINPGSLVLVHSVPNSTLKVGDVITYANPQKLSATVTHRIIKTYLINGKVPGYITKGDGNPTPDQPIVGGLVRGKAVWHVPYIGAWLAWTRTPMGVSAMVYLPALFIMIEEMRRLIKYYKETAPYKAAITLARERAAAGNSSHKFAVASTISVLILVGSIFLAFPAYAMLKSNTVSLSPNNLRVAVVTLPPPICPASGNNTTITVTGTGGGTINVGNSNNQNAQTGNATSTNGGNATTGNATNCNSTNINITVH